MKTGSIKRPWFRNCFISAALAVAISSAAFAEPGFEVRLFAHRVADHPDSGWGWDFPAISGDLKQIAVINFSEHGTEDVSLTILSVAEIGLGAEKKFPLPQKQRGSLAECAESEECVEEAIAATNDYLEAHGFVTMWPLYGAGVRELSLPEEMISFYHYRILFDKDESTLTIAQAVGKGSDGALTALEHQIGEIYLHERWPNKQGRQTVNSGEFCSGVPVPYAAWVNPDWGQIGTQVILLRIGYVASGDCEFPDEWFVKVVEP